MTNTQTTYYKKDCHKGNTAIYTEKNGGTLFIGGWNNGAEFDWNTHVIDLTGTEHRYWDVPVAFDESSKEYLPFLMQAYAGWLSLPFPDYGTPKGMGTREQWVGVSNQIKKSLQKGNDVLVACHGGHGRSGLFCAIVGYLLHDGKDGWSSPVEKIRQIHCGEAVETYGQEKFVYEILGLNIAINRVSYDGYSDPMNWGAGTATSGINYASGSTFKRCPICGTESLFVDDYGMCLTCRKSFEERAPVRYDLSLDDIDGKGKIEHSCANDRCMGIWKSSICQHVVHDQIIYEGYCETCFKKREEDMQYMDKRTEEMTRDTSCALCHKDSQASERYGVCYECASKLVMNELIDDVHNTITDPYRATAHKCDADHMCVGIVRADVCQHVVHNREVEAGLCPLCFENRKSIQEAE